MRGGGNGEASEIQLEGRVTGCDSETGEGWRKRKIMYQQEEYLKQGR